jgi:hypothetical protein
MNSRSAPDFPPLLSKKPLSSGFFYDYAQHVRTQSMALCLCSPLAISESLQEHHKAFLTRKKNAPGKPEAHNANNKGETI